MLELTRLKVFREVAILGSFTKAAQALGVTQPSISHHVAQLERELGAQLFVRQARQVRLTAAGQVFLGHVQPVLARLADAEREVAATARVGLRANGHGPFQPAGQHDPGRWDTGQQPPPAAG